MTPTELNIQIETKVMDGKVILMSEFLNENNIPYEKVDFQKENDTFILASGRPVPNYCGIMEEAFLVAAKMRRDGFMFSMMWEPGKQAVVSFVLMKLRPLVKSVNEAPPKEYLFTGDTPAIAICMAAVAAKTQPVLQHGN